MSTEDIKAEPSPIITANTDVKVSAVPKNPISDRGPPDVPKKQLGKLSCFARGSNIECLVSHEDIVPKRPARRVRDLGKEIVDRANRCTWYEHMVEGELNNADEKEKKNSKGVDEDELSEPGDVSEKSSSMDVCGDENENKKLLKRLEKQQKALLKQQHALNKQLGLEINPDELEIVDSKVELTDDAEKPVWKSSQKKIGSHQRRLRGDVAKQCALRGEGSIKSLIWNEDLNMDEISIKCSQIDAKSISSSASVDAAIPRIVERPSSSAGRVSSSSAISALISNSFCNSLQ